MTGTLDRSTIGCEGHASDEYRKLCESSDLTMTRLGTLGAYALKQLTPEQLFSLHRSVKNTRKPNGRPPKAR